MRNYQQLVASGKYSDAAKQLFDFFNTCTDLTSGEAPRILDYLNHDPDAEQLIKLYSANKKILVKLADEKKWAVIAALKNSLHKLSAHQLDFVLEDVFINGVIELYKQHCLPQNENTQSAQIALRNMCYALMSIPIFNFEDKIYDKYYFTAYLICAKEFDLFNFCVMSKRLPIKAVSDGLFQLAYEGRPILEIRFVMKAYQRHFFKFDVHDDGSKNFISYFLVKMNKANVSENKAVKLAYNNIWEFIISEIKSLIETIIWDTVIKNNETIITEDLKKKIDSATIAFIKSRFGSCDEASDFGRMKDCVAIKFYNEFDEKIKPIIQVAARFAFFTVEIAHYDPRVGKTTLSDDNLFGAAAIFLVKQINSAVELNLSEKAITFIARLASNSAHHGFVKPKNSSKSAGNSEFSFLPAAKEVARIMWKLEMQKGVTHNSTFMTAFMIDNARVALEWINLNLGTQKDSKSLHDFVISAVRDDVNQVRKSLAPFFRVQPADVASVSLSDVNLQL